VSGNARGMMGTTSSGVSDVADTAQELITFPKPRLPKDIEQKLRMPAAE
jgi:hypothetical protein